MAVETIMKSHDAIEMNIFHFCSKGFGQYINDGISEHDGYHLLGHASQVSFSMQLHRMIFIVKIESFGKRFHFLGGRVGSVVFENSFPQKASIDFDPLLEWLRSLAFRTQLPLAAFKICSCPCIVLVPGNITCALTDFDLYNCFDESSFW